MTILHKTLFRQLLSPDDAGGAAASAPPPAGGTPPGATTPPPSGAPATPPAGGEPPRWYDNFQDPEVRDWVKSYGSAYENPEAIARKALNLEKFVGVEKAGRGVVVPKSDAPPEEWQAFYKKVGGTPETPDGYKVPDTMKDDPMVGKFKEYMHKEGLPPMFFASAMKWYETEVMGAVAQQQQARDAELNRISERQFAELREEWSGRDEQGAPIYDKMVEMGRRAAREFMPATNDAELETMLNSIEGALGPKNMLKMFAAIGQSTGEASFHRGEGSGGAKVSTPEGAAVRIAELKKDAEWTKKFMAGDVSAKAEWDSLHKLASMPRK